MEQIFEAYLLNYRREVSKHFAHNMNILLSLSLMCKHSFHRM